jgi:hypothetical protein
LAHAGLIFGLAGYMFGLEVVLIDVDKYELWFALSFLSVLVSGCIGAAINKKGRKE